MTIRYVCVCVISIIEILSYHICCTSFVWLASSPQHNHKGVSCMWWIVIATNTQYHIESVLFTISRMCCPLVLLVLLVVTLTTTLISLCTQHKQQYLTWHVMQFHCLYCWYTPLVLFNNFSMTIFIKLFNNNNLPFFHSTIMWCSDWSEMRSGNKSYKHTNNTPQCGQSVSVSMHCIWMCVFVVVLLYVVVVCYSISCTVQYISQLT